MSGASVSGTCAQRILGDRIGRLLVTLSRNGREPNRLESHHLLDAFSYLVEGQCTLCEQAISDAEAAANGTPQRISLIRTSVDPVTVTRLRERLDGIIASFPPVAPSSCAAKPRTADDLSVSTQSSCLGPQK